MSSKKTLILSVLALALLCMAVSAYAAWPDPRIAWSTYHSNSYRAGQNPDSNNITDPAKLGLIWIFPRTAVNAPLEANATKSPSSVAGWTADADGVFTSPDKSGAIFYYDTQVGLAPTAQAVWQFAPSALLPAAKYYVDVRVPGTFTGTEAATRQLTTQAVYQVVDADGTHGPFVLDQSDQSGSWVRLADQAFNFQAAGNQVVLFNNSPGGIPFPNATVVADVIRFVPASNTGIEVYASPAEAEFAVHWKFGSGDQFKNLAQFVYSGTIEPPFVNEPTAPDSGAAYCVKAVTPTNGIAPGIMEGLRRQVGDYLWRYPRMNVDPQAPVGDLAKRAARAIEGPVENGFYSSPTIAYVNLGVPPATDIRQVVFMTGMDRQVYAFDATGWEADEVNPNVVGSIVKRPPQLLWKGPGVTVSEPYDTPPAGWTAVTAREDVFGGQFLFTNCDPANVRPITWTISEAARKAGGEPANPAGWAYKVYVWLPANKGGEMAAGRVSDAAYTVTYAIPGGTATKEVRIDQNDPKYQGRWVDLGSYFKPQQVVLTNKSASADPINLGVVADALMVVPETMLGFDKCTAVADTNNPKDPTILASTVYLTNPNGRVLSMDAKTGAVNWIYPTVRTKLVVTGSGDADQPNLGVIASSPSFHNMIDGGKLFFSSMDGVAYSLTDLGQPAPALAWRFPDGSVGDLDEPAGFSGSPMVDATNQQVFIGSQDGVVYCLKEVPNVSGTPAVKASQLLWKYPQVATGDSLPLGGVNFSTAAIASVTGPFPLRSWIGGMDGKVWSFEMSAGATGNGNDRRLDIPPASTTSAPSPYVIPNLGSAIQGSVALDGTAGSPIALVGDMGSEGILHWFDSRTGGMRNTWGNYNGYKFLGPLFSSPAIVDSVLFADKYSAGDPLTSFTYVIVGQASNPETPFNGRIYGLAMKGAGDNPWNGDFIDDTLWPFVTDPGVDQQVQVTTLGDDSTPEVEMFPAGTTGSTIEKLYQASLDRNPGLIATPDAVTFYDPDPSAYYTTGGIPDNPDDWILSKDMKTASPSGVAAWPVDTDANRLAAIKKTLKEQAQLRRRQAAQLTGNARTGTLYYEWGEKINLIIWNLPGLADLSGGDTGNVATAKNNIRIILNNKSAGQSAGAEQVFRPKVLWRYNVLDAKQPDGAGKYKVLYQDIAQTKPVERCYAVAQVDIKGTGTRPLSPGSAWYLTAEVSLKAGGVLRIPLAELKSGTVATTTVPIPDPDKNQTIGINNPLAIADDTGRSGGAGTIAWTATPNRNTAEAHFNGNDYINASNQFLRKLPLIDLLSVMHNTGSRVARLGMMDRSATGLETGAEINRFRIAGGELGFQGGLPDQPAIARVQGLSMGIKMPWELSLNSIDYPGIPSRSQDFRSAYSDRDPSNVHCTIPPIVPGSTYETSTLRPDTVTVHVNVPRYQPANNTYGYKRRMNAFVDSNGNGRLDTGYNTSGRQSLYQEAYRSFEVDLRVPPDPRIEVDQQLVDTGIAPHGLGNPLGNLTIPVSRFTAFNDVPEIASWFKTLTIKNTGNVNLFNLSVDHGVNLFNGDGSPVIIQGSEIITSLDETLGGTNINPGDELSTSNLRFTITKPRVGDADPSVMTIPDMRKYESYGLDGTGILGTYPLLDPKISVRIPVSQPIGTYTAPVVRVFADLNGNEVRDAGEPFSDPGFQLKVAVKEAQITGRPSDPNQLNAVRPELMFQNLADTRLPAGYPKIGVTTPAAYRDYSGQVNLFLATNQPANTADYPNWNDPTDPMLRTFANAPWFLQKAVLGWGGTPTWFSPYTDGRWWNYQPATGRIPAFQWPATLLNPLPGAFVESWPASGSPTKSVRHQSPFVAENLDVAADAAAGRTWLIWQGLGNVRNPDLTMTTESRLFYTDISRGALDNTTTGIQSIDLAPGMTKRTPTMVAANNRLWALWAGSTNGNWALYYSVNDGASPGAHPASAWTEPKPLLTPNALNAVSSPNAVQRLLWEKLAGSASAYTSNQQRMLDVIYTGINRVTQNADILLTRYLAVGPNDGAAPTAGADRKGQPFARVYTERLEKHPKYGFYTSRNIGWLRLVSETMRSGAQLPILDNWNGSDPGAPYTDLPFVQVILGTGYAYPPGTHVSATDGSVVAYNPDGTPGATIQAGAPITPKIDKSTGVFTYEYPDGSAAKTILGSALIDPSAGVVRFTKPLKEQAGAVSSVWAEYTPQTLRLTTDRAVDNSPKAFIERSPMTPLINPGMCAWTDTLGNALPAPSVDRLWVLWRKASSGMDVSTIFYRTMRIGVDLARIPGATAIRMNPNGVPLAPVAVTGNLGAWEVDKTGTKVYFMEVDERYRSLALNGSSAVMGTPPGPITINYTDLSGASRSVTTEDVTWIPEVPEQSLLGFASEGNINEDSITAFADPMAPGSVPKIWVFWTSTRGGNSDLFWATFAQSSMK